MTLFRRDSIAFVKVTSEKLDERSFAEPQKAGGCSPPHPKFPGCFRSMFLLYASTSVVSTALFPLAVDFAPYAVVLCVRFVQVEVLTYNPETPILFG